MKRILKKHIGRPIDFLGLNRHAGIVCHGRIESIRNGIAVIEDAHFPGDHGPKEGGGYRVLLLVRDERIVDIW